MNHENEQREIIRAERTSLWNAKIKEIAGLKDGAGNKMDEGIIETVAALNLNGIETTQSCAGHIERYTTPWINIIPPNNPGKKGSSEQDEYIKIYNEKLDKIKYYLDEFYQNRPIDPDVKLTLSLNGIVIGEPEPFDHDYDPIGSKPLSKEEKEKLKKIIPAGQLEMKEFAEFLKSKFLESI